MIDIDFLSNIIHGDPIEKVIHGLAHHAPHILHALEKQYGDSLRDYLGNVIENGTSVIVEDIDGITHGLQDLISSLLS